jgi:hypothetical protein
MLNVNDFHAANPREDDPNEAERIRDRNIDRLRLLQ